MSRTFPALVLTLLALAGPALGAGDARAGKVKGYTCTGCHGIPGYHSAYPTYKVPRITGQRYAYLVAALTAYQIRERRHATMNGQAQSLSQQDIEDISAWLAADNEAMETTPPGVNSRTGQAITKGCRACHGDDGRGTEPAYPILAGQHEDYLVQALRSYRDGSRSNPLMSAIAAALSDRDIRDLAGWYAALDGLQDMR